MDYNYKKYEVNGIHLNVIDEGDKNLPVIIFLHGFPEYSYAWKRQIPFFIEKGYRVIVPDQRGYNQSDKPSGIEAYKTMTLVKDIVELIKALKIEMAFVVGHDWGAAVAWRLSMHYPEIIQKMVIINVPHPKVMKQTLMKKPKQMIKSWYIGFFQLPFLPEKILAAFDYRILSGILLNSSLPGTFSLEDIKKYKKAWKQKGALRGMIHWYRAALKSESNSKKIDWIIKTPTLMNPVSGIRVDFNGTFGTTLQ